MSKILNKVLRLRLKVDKKARERYAVLEEKRQLAEITRKAQEHHEREAEVLAFVQQKAETYREHKTTVVIDSGDAKDFGDKVLLTRTPELQRIPCDNAIRVEEADIPADQFQNMLDERHSLIEQAKLNEYRRRTMPVSRAVAEPKNATIAPADALHFMATGKIPDRTDAVVRDIVDMDDVAVEETEVTNDAAALMYLTTRNHRG